MSKKQKDHARFKRPLHDDPSVNEMILPSAPSWVTPDLIRQTLETWQPFYDHPLTTDDALEIILNISRYWDAVREWDRQ